MMRVVYMGAGDIGLPSLEFLLSDESGVDVVGVYTQPDKPVGRKQVLTPPKIKVLAEEHGVPVFQPNSFRKEPEAVESLRALEPDLCVVMAFGQILPVSVIETPRLACVNLHASLLPRHRGASPIQAAIRDGDNTTGITLMHVVKALDAGDMILKKELPILATDTGGVLHDKLADLGPDLLRDGLPLFAEGSPEATPQDAEQVTYASKLLREHGEIDWSRPAEEIELLIRAYEPWPGTYTLLDGAKLKIYPHTTVTDGGGADPGHAEVFDDSIKVHCGNGTALLLQGLLQSEGRKRLPVADFLRGANWESTVKFG
ncbi:MAG: methionyl-tRNA formyltransferase [Verrucomicrobiota bacterium]